MKRMKIIHVSDAQSVLSIRAGYCIYTPLFLREGYPPRL